jgi:hypothetical protein
MNALLRSKQAGGIMGPVGKCGMEFFWKSDKVLKRMGIIF